MVPCFQCISCVMYGASTECADRSAHNYVEHERLFQNDMTESEECFESFESRFF